MTILTFANDFWTIYEVDLGGASSLAPDHHYTVRAKVNGRIVAAVHVRVALPPLRLVDDRFDDGSAWIGAQAYVADDNEVLVGPGDVAVIAVGRDPEAT